MQAYLKGGLLDHNQTSVKIFCAKLHLGKPQRGHLFQNGHNYCAFFTNEQRGELLSNAWSMLKLSGRYNLETYGVLFT